MLWIMWFGVFVCGKRSLCVNFIVFVFYAF